MSKFILLANRVGVGLASSKISLIRPLTTTLDSRRYLASEQKLAAAPKPTITPATSHQSAAQNELDKPQWERSTRYVS